MTTGSHPEEDTTPSPAPRDMEFMAAVLEGRHGWLAADVADFFSTYHSQHGDTGRSWAWAGVAELVRQRTVQRIEQAEAL